MLNKLNQHHRQAMLGSLDDISANRLLELIKKEFSIRRLQPAIDNKGSDTLEGLCPNPECKRPDSATADGVCLSCFQNRIQVQANETVAEDSDVVKKVTTGIELAELASTTNTAPAPVAPVSTGIGDP